ncbi:ATP-binding protein [Yinghuangia sp. YIM S10712]|uniref:sensor histidine kinase n=1 Tax=Yinghuangia sp. YIM S10712 TaxID=3436930 RepID=UPI003F533A2A
MTAIRHRTLRFRLAATVCVLTAAALLVANGVGLVLLKSYLMDRVDQQLNAAGTGAVVVTSVIDRLSSEAAAKNGDGEALQGLFADRFDGRSRIYIVEADGSSRVLPADATAGPRLPDRTELVRRVGTLFTVGGDDGNDWRMRVRAEADGSRLIVTAVSLASVQATYERLLWIDAIVMAAVLSLLSVVALLMVRVGLRPLTRMEAIAGEIAGGDFARRVPDPDPHTEPGRLALAMNAMLSRVEEEITARRASEQRLRRFLSDVSHELRTPLTTIRGFAELQRRRGVPDEAFARIEAEAARMGVLVDDLLQLARLDEHPHLTRSPVDLLELAADLVRDLHLREPGRPVALTVLDTDSPMFEPVTVSGDELRLRQVLSNLLANSVRHTPAGTSITVRVGVAAPEDLIAAASAAGSTMDPHTPVAVVEVADSGAGVPPEHAERIFDRFHRVPSARTEGGGSGLGLAIAAALAAAHDGRIELVARSGTSGATFRLLLPLPD